MKNIEGMRRFRPSAPRGGKENVMLHDPNRRIRIAVWALCDMRRAVGHQGNRRGRSPFQILADTLTQQSPIMGRRLYLLIIPTILHTKSAPPGFF